MRASGPTKPVVLLKDSMADETRPVEELVDKIRNEFSDFTFTNVHPILNKGDDHAVLILDNEWVFRFPKSESYTASFKHELEILDALRPRTVVSIPNYEYVSQNKGFGGYKMIQGDELTPELFATLSEAEKDALAVELGKFNSAMHSLPTSLRPAVVGDDDETYPQVYARKRELLERTFGEDLVRVLDRFFAQYDQIKPPELRLVHGDLTDDHVLYDTVSRKIAGVIDFGDVGPFDPAGDFTYFWECSNEFPQKMYMHYTHKDEGLLERSHWYFVRYEFSRLVDNIEAGDMLRARYHLDLIFKHISMLPTL